MSINNARGRKVLHDLQIANRAEVRGWSQVHKKSAP
jgi:hypothetical protein